MISIRSSHLKGSRSIRLVFTFLFRVFVVHCTTPCEIVQAHRPLRRRRSDRSPSKRRFQVPLKIFLIFLLISIRIAVSIRIRVPIARCVPIPVEVPVPVAILVSITIFILFRIVQLIEHGVYPTIILNNFKSPAERRLRDDGLFFNRQSICGQLRDMGKLVVVVVIIVELEFGSRDG